MNAIRRLFLAGTALLSLTGARAQPAPQLFEWAQRAGGNVAGVVGAGDVGLGIAVDDSGNVYVTGYFYLAADFGTTNLVGAGTGNMFIAKYDSAGALLWVRQGGGSGGVVGNAVAVASDGGCFVTGNFGGTASFGTTNVTSVGNADLFITKYDASGNLVWLRKAGGLPGNYAQGTSVTVDSSGNCYLTGLVFGNVSLGATSISSSDGSDVLTAKFASNGVLLWARTAGGLGLQDGWSIGVTPAGDYYVAGKFFKTGTFGTTTLTNNEIWEMFVAKYSADGQNAWVRQGGQIATPGQPMVVDANGGCYVTGYFCERTEFGATTLIPRQSCDVFLVKYHADGAVDWARVGGPPGYTWSTGIAIDSFGNCYITASARQVLLAKHTSSGDLLWHQTIAGGTDSPFGGGLAVDSDGASYTTGSFRGSTRFGSITLNSVGGNDIYVAKRPARVPPTVLAQPQSQTVLANSTTTLSAFADGPQPITYQWTKDGNTLAGQTNFALSLMGAQTNDAGAYQAIVSNADGAVTSSVATITVHFGINIGVNGNGSVQKSPNVSSHPPNSTVTLTAVPADGNVFVGWSGEITATNNPLTLTMTANVGIVANFLLATVTTSVEGPGTVSRIPDKVIYDPGESVTLLAQPGRWHGFVRWGDGETNNPRTVIIGTVASLTAFFAPTTALERLEYGGNVRVAPLGTPAVFVDGVFVVTSNVSVRAFAQLTLATTLPSGTLFYTLNDSDPALSALLYTEPFTVRRTAVIRAIAYSADFAQAVPSDPVELVILPTVNTITAGGGAVTVSPPDGPYFANSTAHVIAVPEPGWQFMQWLGDAGGSEAVADLAVARNRCVEAVFGTPVTASTVGSGSVVLAPASPLHAFGATAVLTALPNPGNYFAFWANSASGTNNPLYLGVTNPTPTITAVFAALPSAQTHALAVLSIGRGSVTATPSLNRVSQGTLVALSASPEAGQTFLGWSGDASGTNNPLSLLMNQSRRVTANFTAHPRLEVRTCPDGRREDVMPVIVTGQAGAAYAVEASTNLAGAWAVARSVTNTFGTFQFLDTNAASAARRFFRAVQLPQSQ